jgi:hypothetical protein
MPEFSDIFDPKGTVKCRPLRGVYLHSSASLYSVRISEDGERRPYMPLQELTPHAYEAELETRLGPVKEYVKNYRAKRPAALMLALWNLRILQDESRNAGRLDVVGLLCQMETQIIALQAQTELKDNIVLAELVGAIALISESMRPARSRVSPSFVGSRPVAI